MPLRINLRKYVRVDTSSVLVYLQVRVFCMRVCYHTSSIYLLCFVLLSLSASLRHRVTPKTRTALRHITFFNNSSSFTLPILYRSSLPLTLPLSLPPSLPPSLPLSLISLTSHFFNFRTVLSCFSAAAVTPLSHRNSLLLNPTVVMQVMITLIDSD